MENQIRALIEQLQAVLPHIPELREIESKHNGAKADLEATEAQLEALKAELAKATAGMSAAQLQAQQEHDRAIYAKQQELKALQEKTTAAQNALGEITAQVNSKKSLHDQIVASLDVLRKKGA